MIAFIEPTSLGTNYFDTKWYCLLLFCASAIPPVFKLSEITIPMATKVVFPKVTSPFLRQWATKPKKTNFLKK